MTAGLLISRRRKLELYKTYLGCRTELNFAVIIEIFLTD